MDKKPTRKKQVRSRYVSISDGNIPMERKLALKPLIIIGAAFVVLALIAFGTLYQRLFGASNKILTLSEYFDVPSGKAAILYNDSKQESFALKGEKEYFLPLEFVTQVDDFYYYDKVAKAILYARPTELMQYPVTEVKNLSEAGTLPAISYLGQIYLSHRVLADNSYVSIKESQTPDRIWVRDDLNKPLAAVTVTHDTKMRRSDSKRSDIVSEVTAGTKLYLIKEGKWAQVLSEEGVLGYVPEQDVEATDPVTIKTEKKPYDYTSILMEEPVCLVWHQLFNTTVDTQVSRFENAIDQTKGVNVISPTWFSIISADGTITSVGDPAYTEAAHKRGIKVWALIDNFNKAVDELTLLSGYPYRAKLISMLMDEAKRLNIDGINIDFEGNSSGYGGLNRDCGPHFIQFLRELSVECRKAGLVLSVDNHVPMDYNQYFRRDKQAEVVDYVIIMGYDEHYGGSDPGSTASLPFVKSGIEKTLEQVPKQKVINAVPFYTRLWKMTPQALAAENAKIINDAASPVGPYALSSTAYGAKSIAGILEGKDAKLSWQNDVGQFYTEYLFEDCYYRLWNEDEASMQKRLEIMKQNDIAGIACWKLGMATPKMWDVIYEYLK